MLKIVVSEEQFDQETQEFVMVDVGSLTLEHSLAALSKWEQKWEKAFLTNEDKTPEELLDWVKCMCLDDDPPPELFSKLSKRNLKEIFAYANTKQTATTFNESNQAPRATQIITSELFYGWMSSLNIDWQAQYWHINRLITLIKVVDLQNRPKDEKPRALTGDDLAARRAENERRRQMYGTRG